jgi:tRNA (adenine22-N1)-methyltransferase
MLARRLVGAGRARHCIATERTAERAARIRGFPAGHSLAPRLEIRHGEGLRPILARDAVEVFVLAGLGARAIRRILEEGPAAVAGGRRLVLQPQTEVPALRRWLVARGFAITAERAALERRRLYLVLLAEPRPDPEPRPHPLLSRDELLEAGPCLIRSGDPLVGDFWRRERARLAAVVAVAAGRARARAEARLALAERALAAVESPRPT